MTTKKPKATKKTAPQPKRNRGRPSIYSQELAAEFCARIASGQSMRKVCKAADMPNATTIFDWLPKHPGFAQQYARACEERAESLAEEALEIADDATQDFIDDGEGGQRFNAEAVQRSKLRVDTRKWFASKLAPKKFGDKLDMNHGVQPENPLATLLTQMGRRSALPVVPKIPDDEAEE